MSGWRWPWRRNLGAAQPGAPAEVPAAGEHSAPATGGHSGSLRRRLLLTVMGVSISLWLLSLLIVIAVTWQATSEMFDEALEEGTRLVVQMGTRRSGDEADEVLNRSSSDDGLQLRLYHQWVSAQGQVLRRGDDAPKAPFVARVSQSEAFDTVLVDGQLWRVHVRRAPNGSSAQVAQPMQERLALLEEMAQRLAWPALGLLALLAVLSWVLISRLLRPLADTAQRIARQSPDDLSQVAAQGLPQELQPIVQALNRLLLRLRTALDGERRFTADAAHELRTPLAALRMRVQLMVRERQAQGQPPDAHLSQLQADVDRSTALVQSLLTLTRLEPQAEPLTQESVDLNGVLNALEAELWPGEAPRLQRKLTQPVVQAAPALLHSALRNLIDNARHYGGVDVTVQVSAQRLPAGQLELAVRDDGPGVSAADRARLGERFFRVLGTGKTGNGLGLSIVARIAALHGATLRFEDGLNGRGLGVVMVFPPQV